jgi:hypothetical protein
MQKYDGARFDPPAPLAVVTVRSESSGTAIHDVPILLDTGADVSVLPRSYVSQLERAGSRQYELEAFDGTRSVAPAVTAEIQFLGKSFRGRFLLLDNWHGILGRNVLNSLSLSFDGPLLQWESPR